MNSEMTKLGSTHVLDIRSLQEEEHKTNGAISTPAGITSPVSLEPGSTDRELNTRINNEITSVKPQPYRRKLACFDLINGTKKDYLEICIPLYEAAITSDWESAKVILDKHPELVQYAITLGGDTILHIAVSAEDIIMAENFVDNLLNRMESKDLEIQNRPGDIALTIAVAKGSIDMFKLMLNKHKDLLSIDPILTLGALNSSTAHVNHDMALHFYSFLENTRNVFWTDAARCLFLLSCLDDIALKVLVAYPHIATSMKFCKYSLVTLARSPDALNTTEPNMISRITDPFSAFFHMKNRSPGKDNKALTLLITILKLYPQRDKPGIIDDMVPEFKESGMTLQQIVLFAAETGNTGFVIEAIKIYPSMVWVFDNDDRSMFHIAVMHRHEGIYNLLYEIGSKKGGVVVKTDKMENTMLHLVGKTLTKIQLLQTMSGASLLMQRELLCSRR